jgi:dienelactone hydrolase
MLSCAAWAFCARAQQPGGNPPAAKRGQPFETALPLQKAKPPSRDPPPAPVLNEEIVRLPLTLKLRDGTIHRSEFVLTTFKPNGRGPFPAVIVSHGRNDRKRAEFGRNRLLRLYWTLRGFAVLAPTRIGYGVSGADVDLEAVRGACDAADFASQAEAIAAHIRATVAYGARQPWIDKRNILLVGGSVGGFGSVTAAGERLAGVKAVISFAGGAGGSIEQRPERPCNPGNVELHLVRAAKKGGAIPSLWLYSENDRFWGPTLPRLWHTAYVAAGGAAELHMLPPLGPDGHDVVALGGDHWRPLLDRFLTSLGYAPRKAPGAPPPTGFARLDDIAAIPLVSPECRRIYATFLQKDIPRAFAIGPDGSCAFSHGRPDVMARSLARCAETAESACKLYAVNDEVVWRP